VVVADSFAVFSESRYCVKLGHLLEFFHAIVLSNLNASIDQWEASKGHDQELLHEINQKHGSHQADNQEDEDRKLLLDLLADQ
jgi:hypothetical protein